MSDLVPFDLRCELLAAPVGLNTETPRFGWALESGRNEDRQTAYEICVGDDADAVAQGCGNFWSSGKVASDAQLHIPYDGRPLTSDLTLHWSVRVWNRDDQPSAWAGPASLMTGLMQRGDWDAQWIARYFVLPAGREIPADTLYDNPWQARPADYLRREFSLRGPLIRATVYVTALGLYELYLNGKRVGDEVMAPGWTDYHQRVLYQSHDVTNLVRTGENAIGAILGEGWYSGRVGHNQRRAGNHYGGRPALFCQLHLTYRDGSVERILSDAAWRTSQGPVCYSDFLMGEHYDARLELDGWAEAGFDDAAWQPVEVFVPDPREPLLTAAKSQPVREVERFEGRYLHESGNGGHIFDFGQNFAGYVELNVRAQSGDTFTLRHAEILDGEGGLYTANLRHAVCTDHYTACGKPQETFKPRFTFHGFRYVELTLPDHVALDDIGLTGIAIQSDTPKTGALQTGNELVNKLIANIEWSQRGNFLSVPTDCPQRDERLGWSADAQVFWRTAGYNADVSAFYAKWVDDIIDAQLPDGAFTDIAPSRPLNPYRQSAQPGAPGWGDGPVIMAWQHYLRYGDVRLLKTVYPSLLRWMRHVSEANPDFVRRNAVYNNYGDWLSVGPVSDRTMVATAYWVHVADVMGKIAAALNEHADTSAFAAQAANVRKAFFETFVSDNGEISGDTQTAYLLALDFDILPPSLRGAAEERLSRKLEQADNHLQTGFLGVKHLCPVLADIGSPELAYTLLLNETYPSWGFSIRQGATTIWERWDGWTPEKGFQSANMNSFNHYAYGSVGEWLYARMAGIDWDENDPGFRTVRMRPLFDRRIGWIDASYLAATGLVRSKWTWHGSGIDWTIEVPPNCRAMIELPYHPDSINCGGKALNEAGMSFTFENGKVLLQVKSGHFSFAISLRE
ncbi:alpha-L-rhamnosidase [Labrenzia sp. OB1]|uniref:alpha-L-rhamnosidase n=1 Tax=Labrenzia sp. OB1 TaxID=1561204 RepID=UPI0007B2E803|nr:alpha-L-rhamnosidase [Labrenzia sp. OB1]KZM48480.1 hypothetical protein OA90_20090 [Labrenzia sp. OB1]